MAGDCFALPAGNGSQRPGRGALLGDGVSHPHPLPPEGEGTSWEAARSRMSVESALKAGDTPDPAKGGARGHLAAR